MQFHENWFWFIWFHKFFSGLDFFKFPGPLCHGRPTGIGSDFVLNQFIKSSISFSIWQNPRNFHSSFETFLKTTILTTSASQQINFAILRCFASKYFVVLILNSPSKKCSTTGTHFSSIVTMFSSLFTANFTFRIIIFGHIYFNDVTVKNIFRN